MSIHKTLRLKEKKKLHGSVVHLGVVCEHPSSGTLMVHKSSLIINWQCTYEKLWNLFFLPFCFLSTTCLVWVRRRGGVGGGAPFIRNESISLPNNHFELQKDKKFSWFLQDDSCLHEICSWWNDCWKTPMKHFQNDMLFWFDLFFFVLLCFCYGLCQLFSQI